MPHADPKDVVRRFNLDVIERGDRAAFEALMLPSFVNRTAPPGMPALHALTLRAPPPALAPDSLFAGHIPPGPERPPRSTRSA